MTDFDAIDFFRDDDVRRRSVPLLRVPPRAVPGAARAAPRRGDGHRLRRSDRGVPRHRDVLVVQLRDRTVPRLPGTARRRRRQRAHRGAPRRAADERPAPDPRPAGAHRPPRVADAADHAEAPQGERGVHVAPRRPSDRRVRRQRATASSSASSRARSRCWSSPICSVSRKPITRCSGPSSRRKRPGRAVGSTGQADGAQPVGVPLRAVHRLRRGSAAQSDRRRADRAGHRDVPRRIDCPRSSTSCASPRTCSPPGRRRPCACSATALLLLGEHPELQQLLRDERDRIPNFVEETLRFESPIKGDFRLSRVPTTVGGVDIPAGTTVMVLNGAANRDPRRFERADEFQLDRANARQHIAFGHGIHTCPGAPLARAEARVSIERLLDRMTDITISEAEHGPADARRYEYAPTYILRGLTRASTSSSLPSQRPSDRGSGRRSRAGRPCRTTRSPTPSRSRSWPGPPARRAG